jgi:Sec-independent protein translocase protein TatA
MASMSDWLPLGPTRMVIVVVIILLLFGTDALRPHDPCP